MANYMVLDNVRHRRTRVITTPAAAFGDDVGVVSVLPAEFNALLAHYPIFLRKSTQTGRFEPCVLLGFAPGENLFLERGRWDAAHVPLDVQRRPFLIQPPSEGGQGPVLTIDMDSPRVQEREGEVLFLDDGSRSRYLDRVASALRALVEGGQAAYDYPARLAQLDLIEPVRIDAEFIDGGEAKLEGLYSLNPDALRQVRGPDLEDLHARDYLQWAHWQLGSMVHVSDLIARKNRRLSGAS